MQVFFQNELCAKQGTGMIFFSIKVITLIVKIFPAQGHFLLQYMLCMVASQT